MAVGTNIPLLPVGNLPTVSVAWDADKVLVVRESDSKLVKASLSELFQEQLHITPPPSSSGAYGDSGSIALAIDAIYTTAEGMWGKSPRYTANWEDLTETTRFLLLDKEMNLSRLEQSNARKSIGITVATDTTPGLVKGSIYATIAADGTIIIPPATDRTLGLTLKAGNGPAASTEYVDAKILEIPSANIPVATTQVLGGIRASSTLTVSNTGEATVPIAQAGSGKVGLVPLAPLDSFTPAQLGHAAPVALVQKIASETARTSLKVATSNTPGIVTPSGSIVIQDAESGTINVRVADAASYGTSKVITTIPNTTVTEPGVTASVEAIKSYVSSGQAGVLSPDKLPYATSATRGAIISSATVKVNETGANVGQAYVPTASANAFGVVTVSTVAGDLNPSKTTSAFAITKQITDATSGIKNAAVQEATNFRPTATTHGLVKVVPAVGETSATMDTVPTRTYMQNYVSTAISTSGGWDGGTVSSKAIFNGGIETPTVSSPGDLAVINYGQIKTAIAAGGGGGGGGAWDGGVVINKSTFNGGIATPNLAAEMLTSTSVLNHTQMLAAIPAATATTPGLLKAYTSAGIQDGIGVAGNTLVTSCVRTFAGFSSCNVSLGSGLTAARSGSSNTVTLSAAGGSWAGGVVVNKSAFNGGITTPRVISPNADDVVNYAQIQGMMSGGVQIPVAVQTYSAGYADEAGVLFSIGTQSIAGWYHLRFHLMAITTAGLRYSGITVTGGADYSSIAHGTITGEFSSTAKASYGTVIRQEVKGSGWVQGLSADIYPLPNSHIHGDLYLRLFAGTGYAFRVNGEFSSIVSRSFVMLPENMF